MTLAYAQVLQYWAEEANLPAPSEPNPLAMNVRELMQCLGMPYLEPRSKTRSLV